MYRDRKRRSGFQCWMWWNVYLIPWQLLREGEEEEVSVSFLYLSVLFLSLPNLSFLFVRSNSSVDRSDLFAIDLQTCRHIDLYKPFISPQEPYIVGLGNNTLLSSSVSSFRRFDILTYRRFHIFSCESLFLIPHAPSLNPPAVAPKWDRDKTSVWVRRSKRLRFDIDFSYGSVFLTFHESSMPNTNTHPQQLNPGPPRYVQKPNPRSMGLEFRIPNIEPLPHALSPFFRF